MERQYVVSEIDFVRLNSLANEMKIENLNDVLESADITNLCCIPRDLVTMNSKISYLRYTDGSVAEMTLVYPQFENPTRDLVSVFSPLGKAFFGQREGDVVLCLLPDGQTAKFKILEILYQPEDQNDYHL